MSDELKVKAQKLGQLLANSKVSLEQKMQVLNSLKGLTEEQIDKLIISLEDDVEVLDLAFAK